MQGYSSTSKLHNSNAMDLKNDNIGEEEESTIILNTDRKKKLIGKFSNEEIFSDRSKLAPLNENQENPYNNMILINP
jgi:hypothetical protein